MKYYYYLLLLLTPLTSTYSQQLTISSWTFDFNGNYDFFLDENDRIVLSNSSGIYLYDDSVLIQQISTTNRTPAKGRFGNVLFSVGNYGIESWTQNGSFIFPGDSFNVIRSHTMIQLSDGRILSENGSGDGFVILDSSGIFILPTYTFTLFAQLPMIEINPDLYLYGSNGFAVADSLTYLNRTNNTIRTIASSEIIGSQNFIGFDNSIGNKIYMYYQDAILEVEDDSVLNIAYLAPFGISIELNPSQTAYTTLANNKFALMDTSHFIIYDKGTITYFDSLSGWNVGNENNLNADLSTDGTVYFSQKNRMYKISSPLFTEMDPESSNEQLKVFPNPSKGIIQIDLNKQPGDYNFLLSNLHGKLVYNKVLKGAESQILLPEYLNDGIYIFKLFSSDRGQNYTGKLILDQN